MLLENLIIPIKNSYSGLVGSASSAVIAALSQNQPNLLVITSTTKRAELLRSEIELFSEKEVRLFPSPDIVPGEEFKPSKELIGQRLDILSHWPGVVVAPVKAVMFKTISKEDLGKMKLEVNIAAELALPILIEQLINSGYRRFDIVGERGEFSVRGGIVDIFPLNFEQPVRFDFLEDKIESIRSFDVYSQRSIAQLKSVSILAALESFEIPVFDHLPRGCQVVLVEPIEVSRVADRLIEESSQYLTFDTIKQKVTIELKSFLQPGEEALFFSPTNYLGKIAEIPREAIVFSKHAKRLQEELDNQIIAGSLQGGFRFGETTILSDRELFGEEQVKQKQKPAVKEGVADELLADLKVGDYVVHENYGIGQYLGLKTLEISGVNQEYLLLQYDEEARVYVPPNMAGLVEKYSSSSDYKPRLSRLGTATWAKKKQRVKKSLQDMTQELLQIYAAREKLAGFQFPADDIWQKELEGTFAFTATPDQATAIVETKKDMQSNRPMDRLVCGDVGYGKTEVALRAAAKAVAAKKQVAILVPTTILAEQHYNNFKNRFASTPFVVEMLSRFKSKKEQAQIVRSLATAGVDIVIGTHRLFSKDIKFHDLGLLIVDEEQRFGVAHKEKLKKLKKTIDVLTLSATPIPRTLYLSLAGARDFSVINTPPVDRSPIRTYVLEWNETVIKEAILRELDRGGQIYFLHNFVETIDSIAVKIKRLVPEAKVAVAHGQMPEKKLEQTMLDFMGRKYDVLVCTSIIESGLDITNVNTILIDQADRFGLSQLYQIRGRVGRSASRAYAYLFYRPEKVMTETALERLKAIQEFTALGSGYKLAMRDLEIRGAGNLLGADQSGHIVEVGFDMYCELLEEAVRKVKGIKEPTPKEVTVDLKIDASIPEKYVPDDRQRIAIYRRMNILSTKKQVDEIKLELADRFGELPGQLEELFKLLYLRVKAIEFGVRSIKQRDTDIAIEWLDGRRKKLKSGANIDQLSAYLESQ